MLVADGAHAAPPTTLTYGARRGLKRGRTKMARTPTSRRTKPGASFEKSGDSDWAPLAASRARIPPFQPAGALFANPSA